MWALRKMVRRLDFQNHEIARTGCDWIDRLLTELNSSVLNQFQEELWQEIRAAESDLQKLRLRDKRRKKRWRRMAKPDKAAAERRQLHLEQLERRRFVLEERRHILRCIGDGCAWIILRAHVPTIRPLHVRGRSHFLAEGLGVLGPLSVMRAAHSSGKFFVLNTDLTRCLGVGDLVAVPADGTWLRPLVFEVKTRLEGQHDFATWLIGARPTYPGEDDILARFSEATGFEIHEPIPLREREARQAEEILHGAGRILKHWMRVTNVLDASCEEHWPRVESVLSRAQQAGTACETAEEGIVYAAIRNAPGDDTSGLMGRMLKEVRNTGLRIPGCDTFTSVELRTEDRLSAVMLPFLLWKLPGPHRVGLLSSELEFFSFVSKSVWQEAFKKYELEWLEEHGWWRLSRGKRDMVFDPIQVAKFRADVASSAFSPNALARAIVRSLSITPA